MCGIFAYTGQKEAEKTLLDGLERLEYRGYDSAGIFLPDTGVTKTKGAVAELRAVMSQHSSAHSGITHLRWATHGEPNEINAHPHVSADTSIAIVHNGIIENYLALKEELGSLYPCISETDTEVLANLIAKEYATCAVLEDAVASALKKVRGTYGIVVMSTREPDTLIAARMGSPVVIGLGKGENFIASDAVPILRHTKEVIFLEDGDIAVVKPDEHRVYSLIHKGIVRNAETITWDAEVASKNGYPHFMLKEMFEVPKVIEDAIRGRIILEEGKVKLGGLESVFKELSTLDRLTIVACGTAYYAGLIGKYAIEAHARLGVEAEVSSEFRYRDSVLTPHSAVMAVSQSGETLDTLEAIREGARRGALTLGVVNAVGSTIARETTAGVYNHAGPEISVASTKAFHSQVVVLTLISIFLGRQRALSKTRAQELLKEIMNLPEKISRILSNAETIKAIAEKYSTYNNFLFIGRRYNYPAALEGALKLKELSYVHAEAVSAGEMKHGPLAMIDESFPTIALVPQDSVYEKTLSNIIEIRARKGNVLAIATEGDTRIRDSATDVLFIPPISESLSPIGTALTLQLFAYFFACARGLNVDRPRNLAKSVTVE